MLRYKARPLDSLLHLPGVGSLERGTEVGGGCGCRAAARTDIAVETWRTEQIIVGAR